jgi:2,3-bisphosphoglycerate-dependent phosphoglycerate mutase
MMRHGESVWNKRNLFTGWVDIPLSQKGIDEAIAAGKIIKDIPFDFIYTTPLVRAWMTALLAMTHHSSGKVPLVVHPGEGNMESWAKINNPAVAEDCIPMIRAWQLNERMYGDLQGLNKDELRKKYGEEQVQIWRRSYDVAPPNGESLAMTAERSIPYFESEIVPWLKKGKNILISAHGNSLRSIIMKLDNLSKEQVVALELPTGIPIAYEVLDGKFVKCEVKAK